MKLNRNCIFNGTLKKSWKIVIWISLLFVTVSSAYGQNQEEENANQLRTSSAPAFAIEISIDQHSLKTELYNKYGTFLVDTKIKNISDMNQEIIVLTRYGWSWISDRSEISVIGLEVKKNNRTLVTLKPGLEYSRAIELQTNHLWTGSVTFRLGFVPWAEFPLSTNRDKVKREDIVWSNPVVLAR
jgi:hypothetical protein